MIELKFFTDTSLFYKDGKLKEEPEESLEELMKRYNAACDAYSRLCDALNKAKPKECLDLGLAEFKSYNYIEMLEWKIDLKITHLNQREKAHLSSPL